MATIRKELEIKASPDFVWDVIRDVGAVHRRLAPGFVTDTRLEEGARVVTFVNGVVARELIVSLDEDTRRLVWSVVGSTASHHNSSFEVLPAANGGTRLVWVTDVLPHEAAGPLGAMIEQGSKVIQRTLDSAGSR
jgi:carbon monoxide dehydrogenase subunit G